MTPSARIGVIADDLTGAAEIGAIGSRHGLTAAVLLDSEAAESSADLVCIDSDSRSRTSVEAARQARSSAKALCRLDPAWIYKKVDSVLRGNVLAEIRAIMDELDLPRALLCPANPSFGRTIRKGIYYIQGKPISETDFARDPEHPRRSSDVRELLAAPADLHIPVIEPGQSVPASGIALCEVSSTADVQHWARLRLPNMLCAGGAEFFTALIEHLRPQNSIRHIRPEGSADSQRNVSYELQRDLFVCGSLSEITQKFVAQSQANKVPIFPLPHQIAPHKKPEVLEWIAGKAAEALENQARIILCVQPPRVENRQEAGRFAVDLARIARSVLALGIVRRVFVEGGATAAALAREMGWRSLWVTEEVAPGVAALRPAGAPIRVIVKPGSYPGWAV